MIKKFNEYIKESLMDKLTGPTEEDIKNNFFNGKINIEKYLDFCKSHKMIPFTFDELKSSYLKGIIDKNNYIKLSIKYNWIPFTFDELKNDYRTKKTSFKDFIEYCYYFNYSEEGRNELDNELGSIIKQIIEENHRSGIFYLKKYLKLTNTYILSKTKDLDVNNRMLLSASLLSLSGLKDAIKEGADISYDGFRILNILKFEIKFNKKAQPLLDYILSSSFLPKNYKDYLKDYFDGCEFKTIRTYKEFPGLVKDGKIILYSDSISSNIKYLTIHFDLYWTLHNFYNMESGIELNDNIHNFLVDNKLNIGLFKENEYTSLRLSKFDDVNSINESLLDKLEGPTKEEVKNNLIQQLLDSKISFDKYIRLCKEYDIDLPSIEERKKYWEKSISYSTSAEEMYKKAIKMGYFDGVLKALEKNENQKKSGNYGTINFYYTEFNHLDLFNEKQQKFILDLFIKNSTPSYLLERGIKSNSYPTVKYALEYDNGKVLNTTYSIDTVRTYFLKALNNDCDTDIFKILLEYTEDKNIKDVPTSVVNSIISDENIDVLKDFIKRGL